MNDVIKSATASWGGNPPDWIRVLAKRCAQTSQSQVARRLGRSAPLVSQVLNNKYRGDMGAVEERVRGVFMKETVKCPALGALPKQECQDWLKKSRVYSNANPLRPRMYRACRGCAHNPKNQEKAEQ